MVLGRVDLLFSGTYADFRLHGFHVADAGGFDMEFAEHLDEIGGSAGGEPVAIHFPHVESLQKTERIEDTC